MKKVLLCLLLISGAVAAFGQDKYNEAFFSDCESKDKLIQETIKDTKKSLRKSERFTITANVDVICVGFQKFTNHVNEDMLKYSVGDGLAGSLNIPLGSTNLFLLAEVSSLSYSEDKVELSSNSP